MNSAFALVLLLSSPAQAGRGNTDYTQQQQQKAAAIKNDGKQNAAALNRLDTTPNMPADQRAQIQKQIDQRNAQIDAGLKQFPDSALVQTAGSGAALQSRDVPKALALGDRGVSLALKSGDGELIVDAYKARAQAKLAGGDKAGALSDVEAALERNHADPELIALRGLIGGHAPAKDYKLLSFKTGGQEAGNQAARAVESGGEPAPGAATMGKSAEAARIERDTQAALKSADEQMALDPKNALAKVDDVLKANPKEARAYALKAKADRLLGQNEAARADASAAIALDPKLAAAYAERAVAGALLGRPENEFKADWAHAAELDPDANGPFKDAYARALAQTGKADAATELASLARGGRQTHGGVNSSSLGGWNELPAKTKNLWLGGLSGLGLAAAILLWAYRRGRNPA